MAQNYKNKDLLKVQSFYNEEIKTVKKKKRKTKIFTKKPKEFINKQLPEATPFSPKRKKRPKRLTKRQILENIQPFYDTVGISRREHAHKHYAETYDVKIIDNESLDDLLFLAKRSINDFFRDLLREKRGFKYNLGAKITLKKWNNATNSYYITAIPLKAKAITVINQRFNLNSAYEELKHRLDIWTGEGSGWIVGTIEDIYIDKANYDPLVGRSYIPLPPELNNPKKVLINLKNKDSECFKWCHVRFLNLHDKHSERIKKQE